MRRAGYVGYPNQGAVARGGPSSAERGLGGSGGLAYSFTAFTVLSDTVAETTIATMPQVGILAVPRALCRVTLGATYTSVGTPTITLRLRGNTSTLELARLILTCATDATNQQLDAQFGFVGVGALSGNTMSIGGFGLAAAAVHPTLITAAGFNPDLDKIILTAEWGSMGQFFVGRSALFEVMYAAA